MTVGPGRLFIAFFVWQTRPASFEAITAARQPLLPAFPDVFSKAASPGHNPLLKPGSLPRAPSLQRSARNTRG